MTNILITGGSGFLGHGLVRRLLNENYERICIYSRGEFAQAKMRAEFENDRLRYFIGDVRDLGRLERAMHGIENVIHTAALKRIEVGAYNPDEMVKTNILGTMNVIEAARRTHVEKVVLVSSDKAYEPVSPYGHSKAMAECLILSANTMTLGPIFSLCRYGNVAGSTGSVIPLWRNILQTQNQVPVSHSEATRFWMTLNGAVDVVMTTLTNMKGGESFIPQELAGFTLHDLAQAMGASMFITGLGFYEKKHESLGPGQSSADARRMGVDELREELEKV